VLAKDCKKGAMMVFTKEQLDAIIQNPTASKLHNFFFRDRVILAARQRFSAWSGELSLEQQLAVIQFFLDNKPIDVLQAEAASPSSYWSKILKALFNIGDGPAKAKELSFYLICLYQKEILTLDLFNRLTNFTDNSIVMAWSLLVLHAAGLLTDANKKTLFKFVESEYLRDILYVLAREHLLSLYNFKHITSCAVFIPLHNLLVRLYDSGVVLTQEELTRLLNLSDKGLREYKREAVAGDFLKTFKRVFAAEEEGYGLYSLLDDQDLSSPLSVP